MPRRTHAILDVMVKRVAALLIALVVAAAPIALEACLIDCAPQPMEHAAQAAGLHAMPHGGGAAPSCHEAGPPAAHTWSPGSDACDHHAVASAASVATTRADIVVSPPVQPAVFDFATSERSVFGHPGDVVPVVQRLELRLSSSLRI